MIKNFIFDMGNVLMDFSPDYILSQYVRNLDDIALLKTLIFKSEMWHDLDQGLVSFEEAKLEILKQVPDTLSEVVITFFDTWHLHKRPRVEMESVVKELKDRGYSIYLLSNAASTFHGYKDTYSVFQYFDDLIISADLKISKPDARIYQHLLDKHNLNPSKSMFIDDIAANILAAEDLGIHGYHYNGNALMFRDYLVTLGIL